MKKGFFLLLFIGGFMQLKAQDHHFVFIQTQNEQPFYVKYNKDIFSSTEIGYVIIPRITTDSIEITIGFPKRYGSGIKYQLEVSGKDRGFVMKQLDSTLWALYDLENMKMVIPLEVPAIHHTIIHQTSDPFTDLLAQVTNTPGIAQQILIKDSLQPIAEYYHQVLQLSGDSQTNELSVKLVNATNNNENYIDKGYGVKDSSGYYLGYIVHEKKSFDTVSIYIPADSLGVSIGKELATEVSLMGIKQEAMLVGGEEKLFEIFRQKSDSFYFSVNQIKTLSGLLETEESKLRFFKIAFPQLIDKFNITELKESLIKEENLIAFKKMFVNN